MLIGIFVRHYKVYKGANYIPFGIQSLEKFNLFIGQNGAGKSSILEALDTYFNSREFILHYNEKKEEGFIAPTFLIPKENLNKFSKNCKELLPIISDFLFEVNENLPNYKNYKAFFQQRDNLVKNKETHYLLLAGNTFLSQFETTFITFNEAIKKKVELSGFDMKIYQKTLNQLKTDLLKIYNYLYIPVETSIDEFLTLEAKGMQDLMSQSIKDKIEETLNHKYDTKSALNRDRKVSPLQIMNDDLEIFIEEIENKIQIIDSDYNFQKEYRAKTKLTANHLTDVIIESFFSKRKLRKGERAIKNLSAGERKKTLIDIAYAFLTQDTNRNKEIILAIDEPESSLHISMCYEQFERLEELSSKYGHQMFVTSHWYGALPIIENGNLYHVDAENVNTPSISEFSFRNYFEERGEHPEDIQFKSFFDLASAIISSMRLNNYNWIIVESEEDKNYLSNYLSSTDNIRILPVGGCTIVKILYEYLYLPISQKSDSKDLKGKIFCLVDTDKQGISLDIPEETKNNILKIRRLQIDNNNKVILKRINDNLSYPTEIEEALNPKSFYEALDNTIKNNENEEIKEVWNLFEFDNGVNSSFIKGDNSILNQTIQNGKTIRENKELLNHFVDKNKKNICDNYCNLESESPPNWITEIETFMNVK
jgi:energy-coupling factor transporter ATP-binding protein EcfA2